MRLINISKARKKYQLSILNWYLNMFFNKIFLIRRKH